MNKSIPFKILKTLATIASGTGKRKKLFILIYHRVLDKPDFMRPGEVDNAAFTWQMELLAKYFNVLPLHDALQKMQIHTLPSRAVCITFDDGYADNYTNALPILKQFNLSATFFIANGFLNGGRMWNDTVIEAVRNFPLPELDLAAIDLGRFDVSDQSKKRQTAEQIIGQIKHLPAVQRDQLAAHVGMQSQNLPGNLMMTTEQLKQLYQSGMEIGGHTVNHPILAKLDNQIAEQEVTVNKIFLENILNTSLRFFAYPNGKPDQDYNQQQIPLIKNAGYQAALSTQWGVAQQISDIWQLPRFTPWDKSPIKFMLRMITLYHKGNV
ncbi:MAG: polysaccharide deacetylase family protein [Methylobacter sp.]|nr:polysaccharide deacetylase family protein [Methylobacter sp.]